MKIEIPSQKTKAYVQNNRTNVYPLSNVWSTFNADLQTNLGVFRVSPRMLIGANSNNLSNFGTPVAFRWFDGKNFAVCGARVFANDGTPAGTWSEDGSSGAQTDFSADYSDLELFNGTLCATTVDGLFSKVSNGSATGAWTQRDTLTSDCSHVTTYFKKFDRLYYANLNSSVLSIDTAWAAVAPGSDYAIDLSANLGGVGTEDYYITCMEQTNSSVWVGTIRSFDGKEVPGRVCQWDGISAQITAQYTLNGAQGCLCLVTDPKHDNPYAIDTNGVISAFNGSGFEEVARFPFQFPRLPYNVGSRKNDRFVHPNGAYFTKNGTLRILVNNRPNVSTDQPPENMPSGVWEWSKDNGLVQVSSFGYNTPTDITTVQDYGQNMVSRVGALESESLVSTSAANGTFLAGADIYTNASSVISVIEYDNSLDTVRKKGYFASDWLETSAAADSWGRLWSSYRRFLDANDSIVPKYRVSDAPASMGDITWVTTTTFTILNSAVDVSRYWTSGTGGEVEVLRGQGSGCCAHITNAVNVAGTWTVTIDQAATGATGTATARFQNWTRVFPADQMESPAAMAQFSIDTDSTPRVQVKVCLTFTGQGELYRTVVASNEDIKITN